MDAFWLAAEIKPDFAWGVERTVDKIKSDWSDLGVLLQHELAIKILQSEGHNTAGTLVLHDVKLMKATKQIITDVIAGIGEYNEGMRDTKDFTPLVVPDEQKLNDHIEAGIEGYREALAKKLKEHFPERYR